MRKTGILLLISILISTAVWASDEEISSGERFQTHINQSPWIVSGLSASMLATGYWLSAGDESYNPGLSAGHKILSLGDIVYLNYTVYLADRAAPLSAGEWGTTALMNLCFAGIITTGAVLTMDGSHPEWVKTIHRFGPYAAILSSGILIRMLGRERR